MEKILGQSFSQLCLPKSRRSQVLELAHDTFGGHLGEKRTRERIRLSFTWPTLTSDCKRYCQTCTVCQNRARKTFRDRVAITPIPRAEAPFTHWFVDCLGPILNQKVEYHYCLVQKQINELLSLGFICLSVHLMVDYHYVHTCRHWLFGACLGWVR